MCDVLIVTAFLMIESILESSSGGYNLFRGNSSPAILCWNDKLLTKFPNSVEEVILPSEFTVLSSKNRRTLLHSVL